MKTNMRNADSCSKKVKYDYRIENGKVWILKAYSESAVSNVRIPWASFRSDNLFVQPDQFARTFHIRDVHPSRLPLIKTIDLDS